MITIDDDDNDDGTVVVVVGGSKKLMVAVMARSNNVIGNDEDKLKTLLPRRDPRPCLHVCVFASSSD